jgi:hypothetical protein
MALNVGIYANGLLNVASTSGLFDVVQGHEAKSAPAGNGLSAYLFGAKILPTQSGGLAALSVIVEFQLNILNNAFFEPADAIDPMVMNAAGEFMGTLAAGFTLGNTVREVDLLAGDSEGLRAEAGYVQIESTMFRVMSVFIPILINDVWPTGA